MFYLYFLPVLCTFPAKQVSSLYVPCRYQRHTNKLYQDTEASCISLNNTYKQNVDFRLISKYFCCTRDMNHFLQYRNQYISSTDKAPPTNTSTYTSPPQFTHHIYFSPPFNIYVLPSCNVWSNNNRAN